MEAGTEPQHRTQVNPSAGSSDLDKRARQRNARYPIVAEEYWRRRRRDIASPYPRRSLSVRTPVDR
jgi:hypothetical protein